jgi:hypothetical protein
VKQPNTHISDPLYYTTRSDELSILFIKLGLENIVYERTIYSFMNFLSDIGGLFNSIYVGGKIIVFLFIDHLFLSHIMKHLFQVDTEKNKMHKQRHSK